MYYPCSLAWFHPVFLFLLSKEWDRSNLNAMHEPPSTVVFVAYTSFTPSPAPKKLFPL